MNELQFIIYSTPEEDIRVSTAVKNDTIWLTQKGMAELFGCSTDKISLHLKNIYADGELNPESTAEDFSVVRQERRLERAVSGFFDYIEDLVENENSFTMEQFAASVNEFLAFRRYQILQDKGSISAAQAKEKAYAEYDIFNRTQKIVSDFDKTIKGLTNKELGI